MYIVSIQNGTKSTEIQNEYHKLFSGSIVKGINTIDSFTFSVLPDNPAFGSLRDFTTLVSVYNTSRMRYEFYGRVLYTSPQMSDKGLITQDAVCESYLGFLCDSMQEYVEEQNWTVRGLLSHILDCHNSQLEEYKHFHLGQVWDADSNDNLYVGIQRENTWETIKKKLLDTLGGEIRFRVEGGRLYLDYVEKLGEAKSTELALSKNMKAIVKEKNPASFITRLIPLGAKITEDSEERWTIESVNDGKNYIDDAEAIAEYGLHVGYVEFDDQEHPAMILHKARKWLENNNKVLVKYTCTALDLSLIGLDVDDFDVCNTYPVKNSLLGIDDAARINKKTIDVCDETKTSIEIGESFKTLSEIQREAVASIGKLNADVTEIIRNYATNKALTNEITKAISLIQQTEESILLEVSGGYVPKDDFSRYTEEAAAKLELKVGKDDNNQIVSMLNATANLLTITSDKFKLTADGVVTATAGRIADFEIIDNALVANAPMYIKSGSSAYIGINTLSEGSASKYTVKLEGYGADGYLYLRAKVSAPLLYTKIFQVRARHITYDLVNNRYTLRTSNSLTIPAGATTSDWWKIADVNGGQITDFMSRGQFEAAFMNLAGNYNDPDLIAMTNLWNASEANPYEITTTYSYYAFSQQTTSLLEIHGSLTPTKKGSSCGNASYYWDDVVATNVTQLSDKNKKNAIDDLSEIYSKVFDNLRPVTFKLNDGTSGRLHTGFIAQEVKEAIINAGLDTKDFAAYCCWKTQDGELHTLRYSEFIPLCVSETQKLKARVKELEEKLEKIANIGGGNNGP